ncbi:MAG: hypothetical protein CL587_04505 [Alteromonadaceae bacterium]|nr:hypothetical protein [Alteromonadaceae bacterium]
MKVLVSTFTLLASLTGFNAGAANIDITFSDLSHQSGQLYVALYNSSSAMKSRQHFQSQIITVYKGSQKTVFADVPEGQYGVMVFQDLDGNNTLNSNLLGIPTEPYGFSTNPHVMGPPSFDDIAFAVTEANVSLTITME